MTQDTEYEIKVLGVDTKALRTILKKLGFDETPRFLFRRRVYEFPDGGWIRLRTNGDKTTLTYKKSNSDSIDGMTEVEVSVSDFEKTDQILQLANINPKNYQENFRTEFTNGEVEVTIDEWPLIEAYVEIEGSSVAEVENYIKQLGLEKYTQTSKPTSYVYELNGIDLQSINELRFPSELLK